VCGRTQRLSGGASIEWIAGALVQAAYLVALVSVPGHFEISADEKLRRKLLDRETDGIRRARKSSVSERLPPGSAARRREYLGCSAVVEWVCLVSGINYIHFFETFALATSPQ
jgi:hypothetical protein